MAVLQTTGYGKSKKEVEAMTIEEIKKKENYCIKWNAWRVSEDVVSHVHMEPGPEGDLILGLTTDELSNQFFNNTGYLQMYHKPGKEKRKSWPGYNYFRQIENFMSDHTEKGELYLEYLVGGCTYEDLYPFVQ